MAFENALKIAVLRRFALDCSNRKKEASKNFFLPPVEKAEKKGRGNLKFVMELQKGRELFLRTPV